MSEDVKPAPVFSRTAADCQRDYARVCQSIGDRRYRMWALEQEMAELLEQAKSLNAESARIAAPQVPKETP